MAILTALEPKLLRMNMEEISRYMQVSRYPTARRSLCPEFKARYGILGAC